ncbi:hypothetical protein K7X08_036540 [Anisodus acutangulus]|uniref:Class II Histidinyl-tRNA synthetase (HisRS)-like catalytic core domain-containing protein n=1 Tax=Anisodus acutangulus TaxID=402998 RepID=A0A9Q1QUY8_9SOLA|nr:hypothetical protein K7X08_036540 [Anisodus acutangulus]
MECSSSTCVFNNTSYSVSQGDLSVSIISDILDHRTSALSVIIDAIAALSCEALGADVSTFNLNDSGDGSSDKDVVSVASDLKILLNGSKFVNRESDEPSVTNIPVVHVISYNRVKRVVDSRIVGDDEFCTMLRKECPPPDQLKGILVSANSEEEYVKFAHDVSSLLVMVEQIVSWEAMAAFVSLEGRDFIGNTSVNADGAKAGNKGGKKKKILGKGTTTLVQILKDRLMSEAPQTIVFLENLVRKFLALLDPKDLGFDTLLRKGGGGLFSLRYDLTVPFARYVAMNGLTSFKRYQIAKVYRRDNPSKGRYPGQFGKMMPDFEVIKILTELLDELDIGDYEVKLNHRKLLDGMLAICGVPQEKFRTICSSIDKLDKQSFEQIKKEMVNEKGLSNEISDRIGTFVKWRGPPVELLSKLKQERSFLENKESSLALDELEIMFKALEKSKCIDRVVFDFSLARGLDYYTGVIFEAVFKGEAQVGSIAAGGRYDNLIGMFGTRQVPAVGISLGIERVFAIMEQQKDKNQEIRATETQVLVSILGDDGALAAELVGELWNAKVKAEFP